MQPTDVVVQVRNKALDIVGTIPDDDLKFTLHKMYANVGSWSLTLPADHPLADALDTPGSGVVVSLEGDVVASGPTTTPVFDQSYQDPTGMIEFQGVTDTVVVQDSLALPDPDNYPASQSKTHDKRTGACEDLMHAYVNANIGPSAIASRKHAKLVMGTNGHRGKTVTRKPRFKSLGSLIAGLAKAGRLGFEVVQVGGNLEFRTYAVQDKTATMVLDARTDDVTSAKMQRSPLPPTNVIVGGRGHGKKRIFKDVSTAESSTLSDDWGRRIEVYMDYRGADETPEAADLVDAGQDYLDDEMEAPYQLRIIPSEYADKRYGNAWELGDKITVKIAGKPRTVTATGLIVKVDENGARCGVTLGDPTMGGGSNQGNDLLGNPRKSKGGKHVGDSLDEQVSDLQSELPDLTETTLDGVDWAVDNRVLLLETGQTVDQYITASGGVPVQMGTIIFEKA